MNKIKFGKPYSEIIKIKESFYIENKKHLRKALSINNFYKKQKKRIKCKICNSTKLEKLIISFRINTIYHFSNIPLSFSTIWIKLLFFYV